MIGLNQAHLLPGILETLLLLEIAERSFLVKTVVQMLSDLGLQSPAVQILVCYLLAPEYPCLDLIVLHRTVVLYYSVLYLLTRWGRALKELLLL